MGCLSEQAQVQTTEPPQTTVAPETTAPPTTSPPTTTPPPTTLPPTTPPPTKPPTPVADYAGEKLGFNHGFGFSALEPALEDDVKAFIDYISMIPKEDWIDVKLAMSNSNITGDGVISDAELAYARLSAENPERLRATRDLLSNGLILQVVELYDDNLELGKKLLESIQPSKSAYPSEYAFKFLEKYFAEDVSEEYLSAVVGGYIDWKSEDKKIDVYLDLLGHADFRKLSFDKQDYLLESVKTRLDSFLDVYPVISNRPVDVQIGISGYPWIIDGLTEEEKDYLINLPSTFDPNNRIINTDNTLFRDWAEVAFHKGDITNPDDDAIIARSLTEVLLENPITLKNICNSNVYDKIIKDAPNPNRGKTVRYNTPIEINTKGINTVLRATQNVEKNTQGLITFSIVENKPSAMTT